MGVINKQVILVQQGGFNRDATVHFEYTIDDETALGAVLSLHVFYEGQEVTPGPFSLTVQGTPLNQSYVHIVMY